MSAVMYILCILNKIIVLNDVGVRAEKMFLVRKFELSQDQFMDWWVLIHNCEFKVKPEKHLAIS